MRLQFCILLLLLSSPLAAVPLTLEYEVSGNAPPYNYTFRLILDNHDSSWVPGDTWNAIVFGQVPLYAGGATPSASWIFDSWITDSASYPIGPFITTHWATFFHAGLYYDGPALSAQQYWTPTTVGEQLTWWGAADINLSQGEMAWSATMSPGGFGGNAAILEPARRVGDWVDFALVPDPISYVEPAWTGIGSGFAMASFDVTAGDFAATLSGLALQASGTGDDAAAFSEVGVFFDANGNDVYDTADTRFGQVYSAYPSDDGALTFTDSVAFNAAETRRCFVVVKLNGPSLASAGQTFKVSVTSVNATGTGHSGVPSAAAPGVVIVAPQMAVARGAAVIGSGGTDALGLAAAGVSISLTYTISNSGTAVLNLTGTPRVAGTAGTNVDSVSVTTLPAVGVGASGSTTFSVTFATTDVGAFDFAISIDSTDPASNPYTWTVTGTAVSQPGDSKNNDDGGSCSSTPGGAATLAALGLLALTAVLRRRKT